MWHFVGSNPCRKDRSVEDDMVVALSEDFEQMLRIQALHDRRQLVKVET